MDDSMYPLDAVRPLARALRSAELSWYDADHRLVEKVAEDMTIQDFLDAAEDQRERTLRENARMMAQASRRHLAKFWTETTGYGGDDLQLRRSPPGRSPLFTLLRRTGFLRR